MTEGQAMKSIEWFRNQVPNLDSSGLLMSRRIAEELMAEINEFQASIRGLVEHEDEPCWYDHHGYCQAHAIDLPCAIAVGRKLIGLEHSPPFSE